MQIRAQRLAGVAAVVAATLSLGACATVTRGTTEQFTVVTDPAGAAVSTSNGFKCAATPCTFKMKRNVAFTVTITKMGYKTVTADVKHQLAGAGAGAMAGNVLIGGVIGLGVDAVSGATQELKPNPLKVTLEPEAAPAM